MQQNNSNSEDSEKMKAYSVRLDKETHDYIASFSDAVAYQTGGSPNFSSALRFLVKRQSNLNIKPKFANLEQADLDYLQNFVLQMQNEMQAFQQVESGIGVNFNQLARLGNLGQISPQMADAVDQIADQHRDIDAKISQIFTVLNNIKMILNLEDLAKTSVTLSQQAQQPQQQNQAQNTQANQNQTQAVQPSPTQQVGDQNAGNINNQNQ